MDFENQNKLSEGVGKRIIEALRTNKAEETENISGFEPQNQNNYYDNQEPEYKDYSSYSEENYKEQKNYANKAAANSSSIDILIDLITKLPSGVTKQTGAQIIRHTMEAMGIPMNKVLANAQMAQEELEQGVRNNINIIEEHRTKIKLLDQEIQQYKQKVQDLENIISLFILSESNKK